MNESFKDTISSRKAAKTSAETTPTGDLAKIFAAVKKEAGSDYKVIFRKGAIYILVNTGSGTVGRAIGVIITQNPGNKVVNVGITNGTEDSTGEINMGGAKKFNPADMTGIIDACADM